MNQTTANSPLSASDISNILGTNVYVLSKQTAGLTHLDSLLQPSPRGNCLNWVVGHIALYREYMLRELALPTEVSEGAFVRYETDSDPILEDSENILQLEDLIAIIGRQQERLLEALNTMTEGDLAQPSPGNDSKTIAGQVLFFAWHEGYHLGQLELLRHLAGTDDKVI